LAYLAALAGVLCFRDPGAVVACSAALGPLIAPALPDCPRRGPPQPFPRPPPELAGRPPLHPAQLSPLQRLVAFHNKWHHGFTNLRSRDYIWIPLSKSEYDRLTLRQSCRERLYRSAAGVGLYYGYVIWWRKMMRQPVSHLAISSWKSQARSHGRRAFSALPNLGVIAAASIPSSSSWHLRLPRSRFLAVFLLDGRICKLLQLYPSAGCHGSRVAEDWSFFAASSAAPSNMSVPMWLVFFLTDLGLHGSHHFEPRVPIWRPARGG